VDETLEESQTRKTSESGSVWGKITREGKFLTSMGGGRKVPFALLAEADEG